MHMISVIVPVYKHSGFVNDILDKLTKDIYPSREIIIVVDEPDSATKKDIERWRDVATVIERGERGGKVSALNLGVSLSKGDVLLFIDSDVQIPPDLLSRVAEKIKEKDIVDIRKEVISSGFLARLVNLDYLNSFLSNFISHKFNILIALNGACFAVKRDFFNKIGGFRPTITEDIDLGIRASEKRGKIALMNPGVATVAPTSLKEWYIQRKRWGTGGAIVFLDHIGFILRNPKAWVPSLLLSFPSMLYIGLSLISDSILRRLILAAIILLALRVPLPLATIMFSSITLTISILEKMLPVIISFIVWMGLISIIARKIKWNGVGLPELFAYYFIYSPILLSLYLISFIRVLITRHKNTIQLEDWKT